MNSNRQKNPPIWLTLCFVAVAALMMVADAVSDEAFVIIIGFAVMLLPVAGIVLALRAVGRGRQIETHTHDRIDHSRDLQINPETGKASSVRTAVSHSPQEHWLQQLDTLYRNGTIDAKEYRAMRNRKF